MDSHKKQTSTHERNERRQDNRQIRQINFAKFVGNIRRNTSKAKVFALLIPVMALIISSMNLEASTFGTLQVKDSSSTIYATSFSKLSSGISSEISQIIKIVNYKQSAPITESSLQVLNEVISKETQSVLSTSIKAKNEEPEASIEYLVKNYTTESNPMSEMASSESEKNLKDSMEEEYADSTDQHVHTNLDRTTVEFENSALTQDYNAIISKVDDFHTLGDEILTLYGSVRGAKVCSKANKFNNSLQELYSEFLKVYSNIQESYEQYKENYVALTQEVENFNSHVNSEDSSVSSSYSNNLTVNNPKDGPLLQDFQKDSSLLYSITAPSVEDVLDELSDSLSYKHSIDSAASDSQRIADEFFNLVYYDMVHIGFAEAGCDWFPPENICYVLNVIENRVESPLFNENNVHDVIFAPGQYSPTWEGGFYNEPSKKAAERVTQYLRGNFETGMPSDVLYQAAFEQGDDVWKIVDGIYLCYKYAD